MTNTTSTYLSIQNNLARYQKLETQNSSVKTATAYYQANIGKVTTASQLISNYRLLSFALQAYGLGDQINNRALVQKVLQQGATNPRALANTLPNANWKRFAAAFNFSATGASAPNSQTSVAATVSGYNEQQLEADQGAINPGVQLALYFKRVAPTVTNGYSVLADKNLLQVVQTIFNLPPTASASQLDKEAIAIGKLTPVKDLQNPTKLQNLIERFTATYDANYGPASDGTAAPLTVYDGNTTSSVSAASTVLSGLISSLSTSLASTSSYIPLISPALLSGLRLGG